MQQEKNLSSSSTNYSLAVKLGGSVLQNEEAYRQRAEEINAVREKYNPAKMLVIVSAMKGRTDEAINNLEIDDAADLRHALKGERSLPEFDNPGISARLIRPEIDSAYLLGKYLPGAQVLDQYNPDFPVIANSSYLAGIVDTQKTLARKNCFDKHLTIVSGYGGIDYDHNPVLLGRNASDLVAAWAARLSGANKLIYLKDVPGIYSDYGTKEQQIIRKMSLDDLSEADKVLDSRVIGALSGESLEVVVGHYDDFTELANPENSELGTTINLN